jgi:chemotaxis-related protein WspD
MKNLAPPDLAVDACWRSIGIMGDGSCAELARHVHCRNCPEYAAAAQRNLQRAVNPEYRERWARELARAEPLAPAVDAAALAFRVGAEWLAVPLGLMASVAPTAAVHRLPHRGAGPLLGVINVDGRLLPAVSLARLLGIADAAKAPPGRHAFARLLVLADGARSWALPVDEVHGVLRHVAAQMRPPAAGVQHAAPPLVAGAIADGSLEAGLLDGALLLASLRELVE